ncbi:MAG TPA: NAD(P)/FAD-dependent oxidoreductase [Candidatus Sulfotelmatobacter sp.]|jgi:flavin-dependent dehydrogenase|nr:NAD(P)/FAD-dependent oxidoreductase [Candidatus Sulfotelmatobacter sp.]
MTNGKIQTVAILGGGPAASTLATLLVRQGVRAAIYHVPKPVPLAVGESLVPAIIPMLRQLGVEDEVKSFSTLKPGATFNIRENENYSFWFERLIECTGYAYNVPRNQFDAALLNNAKRSGATIIEAPAKIERIAGTDKVKLSDETLAAAGDFFNGKQPDLIVDATGRLRMLPNLMGIAGIEGGRRDMALHAHVDTADLNHPGHVHSTRLDHGWSWRIPLPGRVSIGLVIPQEHLMKFGATKEERYDNALKQDSVLSKVTKQSKRITPVVEYANYQLVSERMVGDGWALVGDTAGFIDPVFSSGLLIGMTGGVLLAETIAKGGTPEQLREYEAQVKHHLTTWHEIVGHFYDGRLFTFFRAGEALRENWLMKLFRPHVEKHMGRIFTGAASSAPYSMKLLRFGMKYALRGEDPNDVSIR